MSNLVPLNWMHAFHPDWIRNLIEECVKKSKISILWPVCNSEVLEREVKMLSSNKIFDDYLSIRFKYSLSDEENKLSIWPTPNWGTSVDKHHQDNSNKFNCPKWKCQYWIKCRGIWHKGLNCKDYRQNKGYPTDDLLFYKYVRGGNVIKWATWKDWTDNMMWCHDNSWYSAKEFNNSKYYQNVSIK